MKRKATSPASPAPHHAAPSSTLANPFVLPVPSTPSKRFRTAAAESASPSPRKTILKDPGLATPKRTDRVHFSATTASPPPITTNADRSARRKSVRHIVSHGDNSSSDSEEDDSLARRIYAVDDSDSSAGEGEEPPVRRGPGRPKGSTKKREITPPPSTLEGPESYFHQNRKTRQQTSTATLAGLKQLDHSAYFSLLRAHAEDHVEDRENLMLLHTDCFGQWVFELSQGFNLLLYGYGSKRKLLEKFAERVYTGPGSVVVVNGYIPTLTVKDVLATVVAALLGPAHNVKLGTNPHEILDNLLSLFDEPSARKLTLVIHNLDGEALRTERSQAVISRLAAHPKVSLAASIDHVRAPLLWDAARVSQFNFLWHDATTFEPYTVEIPADEALSLVDGAGRAGGTKGVKYVLASLPSNAKSLFRILVSHQLQAMLDDDVGTGKKRDLSEYGVEYRVLYQRAVGEFICSNDVAFRTLLKEFMDHQMVTSRKDSQGTEVLWAPFRREDLEGILEEVV